MDLLYGTAAGGHNPRKYQHIDRCRPGSQQSPCARVQRSAGREHVVDENKLAAGNFGGPFRWDAKRALHVVRSPGLVQSHLLRRCLHALERTMRHRAVGRLADHLNVLADQVETAMNERKAG